MTIYEPNDEVRPTGAEAGEFIEAGEPHEDESDGDDERDADDADDADPSPPRGGPSSPPNS